MKRKAQVAVEYLMIVGIVLLFIIPVWTYMNTIHRETTNELHIAYAKNAAKKLVDTADLVYSQGAPASVNVAIYIPNTVKSINITNNTVTITLESEITSYIYAQGIANLNGSIPTQEGNYVVHVEAVSNFVQIGLA